MMFGVGVSLCTTRKSFVGAVPHMTLPQDVVAIPTSAEKPYILRERNDGSFQIIGPCYIHGIMGGEAWPDN